MKKIWNISSWIAGITLIISLFAFSDNRHDDQRLRGIQIHIEDLESYPFIKHEEIEEVIYSEYPFLDSLYCREINKSLLEESLDNHPSIDKAEVYSTLTGILWINISQKRPVFRVQHSDKAYYVDASGGVMPLSPHYSADVPLVTGDISKETEQEIYRFFSKLEQDDYYQGFFHGLKVQEDGQWILYPELADQRIVLGEPIEIDQKLHRLRVFYQKTGDTPLIDEFKTLNLNFDGQVVGSKN